jgi:acetyl-CoA C-acetyltransferase
MEDYLASPLVADPLRKLDICQVTDSAGAVVLVRAERARDLPRPPVLVQGFAERYLQHATPFGTDDWIDNGVLAEMGRLALERAGLARGDIDLVQIYDAFTINVLIGLEQLGFCGRGESGAFVQGGRIAPGRTIPHEHLGRRPVLQPRRHVRHAAADRVGAATARRLRRAPGAGARNCLLQAGGLVMSAYMVMVLGTAA